VDDAGRATHLLTAEDGLRAGRMGATEMGPALRTDFETAAGDDHFNDVYVAAGRGLPIAVVDEGGRLAGCLDPRKIMEEMGRVERLIDDYEREVFM